MEGILEKFTQEILDLTNDITNQGYDFAGVLPEIEGMQFSLMANPDDSLSEFMGLYSVLQAHQSRIVSIIITIRQEKQTWIKFKYSVDRLFKKLRNTLLSSRKDIQTLKSQELRDGKINEELEPLVNLQQIISGVFDDLDYLIEICELKRDDLDKANTNMSRQQKVVETLVGLGYPAKKYKNENFTQGY